MAVAQKPIRRTPSVKGGRGSRADIWALADAQAQFSELVRRARDNGPQRIRVSGDDEVVIIAAEELARLLPPVPERQPLVEFLQGLGLSELDVERERDRGRDVAV
jgi:prevent-host-death family protein